MQNYRKSYNEDDFLDSQSLHNALQSIALEIERVEKAASNTDYNKNEDVFDKLMNLHFDLNNRNKQIRKLKSNTNNVIQIAKAVFKAKEDETMSLNRKLMSARSEVVLLLNKQNNEAAYQKIEKENQILTRKMEYIRKSIEIAYLELLEIRNEQPKENTLPEQLKKIIVCCGQYYADYCNEHETLKQVKKKNKFLNTKITFLENSLEAAMKEIKCLRCQLLNKCGGFRGFSKGEFSPKLSTSDNTMGRSLDTFKTCSEQCPTKPCPTSIPSVESSEINGHLTKVKDLLDETDSVIRELQNFSLNL